MCECVCVCVCLHIAWKLLMFAYSDQRWRSFHEISKQKSIHYLRRLWVCKVGCSVLILIECVCDGAKYLITCCHLTLSHARSWGQANSSYFESLARYIDTYSTTYNFRNTSSNDDGDSDVDGVSVCVYGEWCGPGIQKGNIALNKLKNKIFAGTCDRCNV